RVRRASPLFPYTTLFRSADDHLPGQRVRLEDLGVADRFGPVVTEPQLAVQFDPLRGGEFALLLLELERDVEQSFLHTLRRHRFRSEEHTSELQSRVDLVC